MIKTLAQQNVFTTALIIILAGLFIFILVVAFILNHQEKKNITAIKNQSNSVRVFIIDYKKRSVRHFNRSDLKNQRTISFNAFLEQFMHDERQKILNWIEKLLSNDKDTPLFLECDVLINKDRKSFFSFLQVQKVDTKRKVIHIESYLMKYLTTKSRLSKKKRGRLELTNAQLQDIYNNSKHKKRGACFAIQIYHSHVQVELNERVDNLLVAQLKNVISPFLNNSRYLNKTSDNVFVLYDFKINSRREIMQLSHSLQKVLQKYIVLNSFDDNYEFSIGVCEFKNGDGLLKNIVNKAKAASLLAHSKQDPISIYDSDLKVEEVSESSFENEIKNIIKNKELVYQFRPIVNVKRGNIYGYYSHIKSLNQLFADIDDIREYSYKIGQSKELFSLLTKGIVPRFINEKENATTRLFYKVAVSELDYVLKSFTHIAGIKDSNIVLVLDELEIYYWKLEESDLKESVESFKKRGFEVALCLKENDFMLTNAALELFDFFIFDEELTKGLKRNGRMRLALNSLLEMLEPFRKPIIAIDMESWTEIELITKMGINYLSSDAIASWNEMILPIEKKRMAKIKALNVLNKD